MNVSLVVDLLRLRLINSGMSTRQIAARTGVSHQTVASFLNGKRSMTVRSLELLERFVGVEVKGERRRAA